MPKIHSVLSSQLSNVSTAAKASTSQVIKKGAALGVVDSLSLAKSSKVKGALATGTVPGVPESFPLQALSEIPAAGRAGTLFMLDGGALRELQLMCRRVRFADGPGFELVFKLTAAQTRALIQEIGTEATRTSVKFPPLEDAKDGTAWRGKQGSTRLEYEGSYADKTTAEEPDEWVYALSLPGGTRLEVCDEKAALAVRGMVRIELHGNDATCSKALVALVKQVGLEHVFVPPTEVTKERAKLMRVLWQADVKAADSFTAQGLDNVKVRDLKAKLADLGYPEARLKALEWAEVAPGHYTVMDPAQVGVMVEAGVRYLYSTVESVEHVHALLVGGQKSSLRRYQEGIIVEGMSTTSDFCSGGAKGVFTRMVTLKSVLEDESWHGRRYRVMLKPEILARTDWYGWAGDEYGRSHGLSKSANFGANLVKAVDKDGYESANEVIFRHANGPQWIAFVTAAEQGDRTELLNHLRDMKFQPPGGMSLEAFVRLEPTFCDYGAPPVELDKAGWVARAKKPVSDELRWLVRFGPVGEARREVERTLLASKSKDHRELFVTGLRSGRTSLTGDELWTALSAWTKKGASASDKDFATQLVTQGAAALLRLNHPEITKLIEAHSDAATILAEDVATSVWLEVLESLAKGPRGPGSAWQVAWELSHQRLLRSDSSGLAAYLAKYPVVKPKSVGPWLDEQLKSLKKGGETSELSLCVLQAKKPSELEPLLAKLATITSHHDVDELAQQVLRRFGAADFDPKVVVALLKKHKDVLYWLKNERLDILLSIDHPSVLAEVQKAVQDGDLEKETLVATVLTELKKGPPNEVTRVLLAQAASLIGEYPDTRDTELMAALGGLSLFKVGNLDTFVNTAAAELSSAKKTPEASLKLAWLLAGPEGVKASRQAVLAKLIVTPQILKSDVLRPLLTSVVEDLGGLPIDMGDLATVLDKLTKDYDEPFVWLMNLAKKNLFLHCDDPAVLKLLRKVYDSSMYHDWDMDDMLAAMERLSGLSSASAKTAASWIKETWHAELLQSPLLSDHLWRTKQTPTQMGLEPSDVVSVISAFFTENHKGMKSKSAALPEKLVWLVLEKKGKASVEVLEALAEELDHDFKSLGLRLMETALEMTTSATRQRVVAAMAKMQKL